MKLILEGNGVVKNWLTQWVGILFAAAWSTALVIGVVILLVHLGLGFLLPILLLVGFAGVMAWFIADDKRRSDEIVKKIEQRSIARDSKP